MNGIKLQKGTTDPTDRRRQTPFWCLDQNSERSFKKQKKMQATEVWWKCFFRASPSHKPQQLSSTAPGMCRKGCSLTAAEVRSTLEVWVAAPAQASLTHTHIKKPYLWRCEKSTQQLSLLQTYPPPLTLNTLPLCFHLHLGISQNWVGQTVCQCATFILPGLWDRGQISLPYTAT